MVRGSSGIYLLVVMFEWLTTVSTASTATSPSTLAVNMRHVANIAASVTARPVSAVTIVWNLVRIQRFLPLPSRCNARYLPRIVCGSLARGPNRPKREDKTCQCDEGWTGINCNVCTNDRACDALTETGDGGVCYTGGEVVKQNYQMCNVTNKAIRDLLKEQVPQVTFTCNKESGECDFQCQSPPSLF